MSPDTLCCIIRGFASWYDNKISCDTATACCDDLELCNALQLRSVGLSWHIWSVLIWSVVVLLQAAGAVCVLGGGWVQSCQLCRHFAARWIRPVAIGLSLKPGQISNSTTGSTRINKANKEYMESDYDMIIIMIIYDYIIYDIILWFMIHDSWWNFWVMPSASGWFYTDIPGVVFSTLHQSVLWFVRFWLHEC